MVLSASQKAFRALDLVFLLTSWSSQWINAWFMICLHFLIDVPGHSFGAPPPYWHINVITFWFGVLATSAIGTYRYYLQKEYLSAFFCFIDWDSLYFVIVRCKNHLTADQADPDISSLQRRNALWRGLPAALITTLLAIQDINIVRSCNANIDGASRSGDFLSMAEPFVAEKLGSAHDLVLPKPHGLDTGGGAEIIFQTMAPFIVKNCPMDLLTVEDVSVEEFRLQSFTFHLERSDMNVLSVDSLAGFHYSIIEYFAKVIHPILEKKHSTLLSFMNAQNVDGFLRTIKKFAKDSDNEEYYGTARHGQVKQIVVRDESLVFRLVYALLQSVLAVRALVSFTSELYGFSLMWRFILFLNIGLDGMISILVLLASKVYFPVMYQFEDSSKQLKKTTEDFIENDLNKMTSLGGDAIVRLMYDDILRFLQVLEEITLLPIEVLLWRGATIVLTLAALLGMVAMVHKLTESQGPIGAHIIITSYAAHNEMTHVALGPSLIFLLMKTALLASPIIVVTFHWTEFAFVISSFLNTSMTKVKFYSFSLVCIAVYIVTGSALIVRQNGMTEETLEQNIDADKSTKRLKGHKNKLAYGTFTDPEAQYSMQSSGHPIGVNWQDDGFRFQPQLPQSQHVLPQQSVGQGNAALAFVPNTEYSPPMQASVRGGQ